MSAHEVVQSFRQAKNPKSQLVILAQLNCCTVETIREIIENQTGTDVRELLKDLRPNTKISRIDTDYAIYLYRRGYSDTQIMAEFGVTRSSICRWRKRHSLPPNIRRSENGNI